MYSELKQILVMSNSELTLIKGDVQEGGEFDILKSAYGVTAASSSSNDHQEISVKEDDDDTKQDTCQNTAHSDDDNEKKPRLLLGGLNATDHEDDEGFKTPTYDNQIPAAAEIKQCPPAPRKPKPLASTKRKSSSSSSSSASLRLDLSQEVNSLFPKPIIDDLHRKIKKARRDN